VSLSDLAATAKKLSEYQANLLGSFDLSGITALPEPYRAFAEKLEANTKSFTAMLQTTRFSVLLEQFGRETPYNYDQLLIDDQYVLIESSRLWNFGTVEVLPKTVITELLSKSGLEYEINQVLLLGKTEIMNKTTELVEAFLEEPKIKDYGFLLGRSVEALNDGHYEASQALSTALWDSFLSERAGRKDPITSIKGEAEKPDIEAIEAIEGFSPIYDYGAFGPALSAYKTPGASAKYSRNGTIHHLSTTSANQLNSIKAITIAAGVLGRTWRTLPGQNK
jgi:hypothetical protein